MAQPIRIPQHTPPSPKKIRELMFYHEGKMYSTKWRGGTHFGKELGTFVKKHGRVKIQIEGKKYYRARVVWCYHKGIWPEFIIDHIDRDRMNDRIENLRDITQKNNMRNKNAASKNESGRAGVSITKTGKWRASIEVDGKSKNLGVYEDLEDAISVREVAEKQYW